MINDHLPSVKVFKGNVLMEFGYNDKTEFDVHLIYRLGAKE